MLFDPAFKCLDGRHESSRDTVRIEGHELATRPPLPRAPHVLNGVAAEDVCRAGMKKLRARPAPESDEPERVGRV